MKLETLTRESNARKIFILLTQVAPLLHAPQNESRRTDSGFWEIKNNWVAGYPYLRERGVRIRAESDLAIHDKDCEYSPKEFQYKNPPHVTKCPRGRKCTSAENTSNSEKTKISKKE
jgi:hypothetical protein